MCMKDIMFNVYILNVLLRFNYLDFVIINLTIEAIIIIKIKYIFN